MTLRLPAALAAALLAATPAAALETFDFTSEISATLPSPFSPGTFDETITGTLSFDLADPAGTADFSFDPISFVFGATTFTEADLDGVIVPSFFGENTVVALFTGGLALDIDQDDFRVEWAGPNADLAADDVFSFAASAFAISNTGVTGPSNGFALAGDIVFTRVEETGGPAAAIPLPGALPLAAAGLGALGLLSRRRRRAA